MSKEAMKQALEALESATPKYTRQRADQKTLGGALDYWKLEQHQRLKAITSLRQAIAEAEKQEPVAWIFKANRELLWPHEIERKNSLELNEYVPLYFHTHPNREWVGLTDEEIATTADYFKDAYGFTQGVLWAEAKLKEKNQ